MEQVLLVGAPVEMAQRLCSVGGEGKDLQMLDVEAQQWHRYLRHDGNDAVPEWENTPRQVST